MQDTSTTNPAPGSWSDAVYIGTGHHLEHLPTSTWARCSTPARSQPGGSYTGSLTVDMPSLTPGQYHIFVRADIYDQTRAAARRADSSKTTASAGLLTVAVDSLTLGVPYATTLSSGQERLLQVTVPAGATLEVIAHLRMPPAPPTRSTSSKGRPRPTRSTTRPTREALPPDQNAIIPSTIPGVYYV